MQTQTVKAGANVTYNWASYLASLYIKQDEKCTHTRLKDVELGIKGGAYLILDSELEEFYKKYYQHVFVEGKQEYLTEIQLHDAGPILVDFDFKYDVSVEERQHTKDHVVDMVLLYMNTLKKFLKIDAGVAIPVFVFEKTTVNCKTDMTKDGIHMIVGIHMERKQQLYLRSQVLLELPKVWGDLPVTNSWEDVIDNSITSGKTGWQLYNSRKPGYKAYLLKYHFLLKLGGTNGEWEFSEKKATEFKFDTDFKLLTARYRGHQSFQLVEEYKQKIDDVEIYKMKMNSMPTTASRSASHPGHMSQQETDFDESECTAVIARLNPERARDFANWNLVYLAIMNNREMSGGMKSRLVHKFSALCPEKYDDGSKVDKHIASWREVSYNDSGYHFASVRMWANEDSPVIPKGVCRLEIDVPENIEAEKAWIDKNTKVVDARSYKPWSETMFKIYNKYNGNNIGRKIAHYFSQKDKDGYDAVKVDYSWNIIRPEEIEHCVFGLGVDERATMLNESFLCYQSQFIAQTKNRNKKQKDVKQQNVSFSDAYDAMKKEFEKTHFKCLATSCFVQEVVNSEEERNLILRNKSELMVAFSHLRVHYQKTDKHGNVQECETRFIEEWIDDEHIRRYDRMDNYPNLKACPECVYNLWTPFRISTVPMPELTEEIKQGVSFLLNHLSIMCSHEIATLQEFKKWIAQMIQHPEIKSYMPIFQSEEGAGKGSFCELMRAMLGKSKVFMTSSPDEYVWGRFNNLMETSFLIFMDEINRFMTGSGLDKIKNVVSEPTIQIQHKGKGAYTMNSFHRFASLTNAWDGGMPVHKKARRFLMCEMSNEKIGNMDYFNKFYELLQNDKVLRAFYEHFATQEVEKKLPPPIQTDFQKQMSELTVDVPTLWLRDFIGDAKRNKSTLLQMKETSQMYKIINKETKTEFKNGAFVTTEIADSGNYVIELFGKTTFEKIMEWSKKNGYEKYETTPTKIIIYLLRKKWSGLKKGRVTNTGNTIYLFVDTLAEMFEL